MAITSTLATGPLDQSPFSSPVVKAPTGAPAQPQKPRAPQPRPVAAPAPARPAGTSVGALQDEEASLDKTAQAQGAALGSLEQRNAHLTDAYLRNATAVVQLQRQTQIGRAQELRKFLPVLALFALTGAVVDGMQGAIAAVGGGLAGLSAGENQRYHEAMTGLLQRGKSLLVASKQTTGQIRDVLEDSSKTTAEKLALVRTIEAQSQQAVWKTLEMQTRQQNFDQEQALRQQSLALSEQTHREALFEHALGALQKAHLPATPENLREATTLMTGGAVSEPRNPIEHARAQQTYALARIRQAQHPQESLHEAMRRTVAAQVAAGHAPQAHPAPKPTAFEQALGAGSPSGAINPAALKSDSDWAAAAAKVGLTIGALDIDALDFMSGKSMYSLLGRNDESAFPLVQDRADYLLKRYGGGSLSLLQVRGDVQARTQALANVAKTVANANIGVQELKANVDKLLTAARGVSLQQFPSANALLLAARNEAGDPNVPAYENARFDVAIGYVRAIGGTGELTDTKLNMALTRLARANNYAQLKAATSQVMEAAENFRDAGQAVEGAISESLGGKQVFKGGAPKASAESALPPGWSQ